MARLKIAYIGGGSTRAPGTMMSFIEQGENFDGSEFVLVDLNEETLGVVEKIARSAARSRGLNLAINATTDRHAALQDCDVVLASFRPGGFEARYLDESIPLKHGVIGQETQGPGGFFMALRSIHVLRQIVEEMEDVCPDAWLVNYTNPINIVSQAITHHSPIRTVSLCEGPIFFGSGLVWSAGLDGDKLDSLMIGLNHACWSVRHLYEGRNVMPILAERLEAMRKDPNADPHAIRMLALAVQMDSLPADYMRYYYYLDEELERARNKKTTRSQDIMADVPRYWEHYREQARTDDPKLDPETSRGGINELELAVDVIDALFNDRREVWPVNMPNWGAIPDFPDDLVVEVPGFIDRHGISPIASGEMPHPVMGLLKMLGEYQALTAEAAWCGSRKDAVRALTANPLVMSLSRAEAIYDEMAQALSAYLPARLLKD